MPRKFYTPKNKFVKNSNLSEDKFLSVLKYWCEGVEADKTAKKTFVSKVTVHKYYQALGSRALQTFNYRQLALKRPDLMKKLIATIRHFLVGTWNYDEERRVSPKDVNNSMLEVKPQMLFFLKILKGRFKQSYGINSRFFGSYVGYASLIMAAGRESGLTEISNEKIIYKLSEKAFLLFKSELEAEPLDLNESKSFLDVVSDF